MDSALLNVSSSVTDQHWTARCTDDGLAQKVSIAANVPDFIGKILVGRGVDDSVAASFLAPTLRDLLPDPSSFQDMDKACTIILDAMQAGQSITIFADYDVDGGTSAAQLIRWARALGHDFGLYVPDRVREGYGPTAKALTQLKSDGVDLVITVDCGAAAAGALEAAAQAELPVVVVDHHMMDGDMPPCAALINPNRPDDTSGCGHLAAAGVTFILLVGLCREARRRGLSGVPDIRAFLDLAAMGTICDVVPLTGVNRAITSQGLKVLSQRRNPGLDALAEVAGASGALGTYEVGFILGPRINAGGRIGRADMGARLLSEDDAQDVMGYAQALDQVNQDRKLMQDAMLSEALSTAAKLPSEDAVIIVAMEGWHPGVIGIVAGRLKDRFGKPAIVIGIDEQGIGKGSGRSIKGVNLGGAITKARQAGLLTAGGGHEMAGGLTMDGGKVDILRAFMNSELGESVAIARAAMRLKIDAVLSPAAATAELMDTLAMVGPYGSGNPQPMFAFADLRISYAERLRGGHVRCSFEDASGARISGICFRAEESGLDKVLLSDQDPRVHVAGRLKKDSWKGRTRIDLQVQDIALA